MRVSALASQLTWPVKLVGGHKARKIQEVSKSKRINVSVLLSLLFTKSAYRPQNTEMLLPAFSHLSWAALLSLAHSSSPCPHWQQWQRRFPHSGGQWNCMSLNSWSCRYECVHHLPLLLLCTYQLPLQETRRLCCCPHKLETRWCYQERNGLQRT